MRYVILGAGAVGGSLGASLTASGHDVVLVARGAHYEAIARDGLRFETPEGAETAKIAVVDRPESAELREDDVVLLAVKSQDTLGALASLLECAPAGISVVCLQNGVENERVVLRYFRNVYGSMVIVPATYLSPGVVSVGAAPTFGIADVGRYPTGSDEVSEALAEALNRSRWSSVSSPAIQRWKYAKLIDNLSNVTQIVLGLELRSSEVSAIAKEEGARVLRAAKIDFASSEEMRERRAASLRDRPVGGQPRLGASTWQSIARGTGSVETDFLNGEIVLLGRLHAVPTPANELLQQLALEIVSGKREPGSMSEEEFLSRIS